MTIAALNMSDNGNLTLQKITKLSKNRIKIKKFKNEALIGFGRVVFLVYLLNKNRSYCA